MAMMALGCLPPAEVPIVSNDCMVIDSSGLMHTASLSAKTRSAKFANAAMSTCPVGFVCDVSGTNSNAPIPRLPINESLSSGVMSLLDK